jgi:hypothetical protein
MVQGQMGKTTIAKVLATASLKNTYFDLERK